MARVRVQMKSAGARALLNSPGAQEAVLDPAQSAARRAGDGFEADVQPGRNRAHAMIKTTDADSIRRNAKTNAILRAIGGGS